MSSLKFGTSGLRGLVVDLTPQACRRYTLAFLTHLRAERRLGSSGEVLVGRDLRSSSPSIAQSCLSAISEAGLTPVDCGELPTPALALAALRRHVPAIMVTGSHIPDDRNGLKFYRPDGEIDKADEAGIIAALQEIGEAPPVPFSAPAPDHGALDAYLDRYISLAPGLSLSGKRIGVYQHSSVARDVLVECLTRLGAEAVPLARSDAFIPVDTEALRSEDVTLAARWAEDVGFDALVSTDGDADRPLVADENGRFLRGDIVGLLTAACLRADTVVTPVTSTSAIEASELVKHIRRTRVGSPYVLAAMADVPSGVTVGFEANGGVLLGSEARLAGRRLAPLPTRDALLPVLAVLALANARGLSLSELVDTLPERRTASDRIKDSPTEANLAFLERLAEPGAAVLYFAPVGALAALDLTDGVQARLKSGETVHYRASGNAPELRCYTEAVEQDRADDLLVWGLAQAQTALHNAPRS